MHYRYLAVIAVAGSLVLNACATIISGTKQQMSFQSSPEDVTVTVTGRIIGKTPITVQLDKKSGQTVTFSKDGYKPITMELTTHLDSWFWGNIIIGGLLGSTTDGVSGAVNEYSPTQYLVTLTPEKATKLDGPTTKAPRDKVIEFVLVEYQHVAMELNGGKGEHLDSLLKLLNIPHSKRKDTLKSISVLLADNSDMYAFASQVADLRMP